MPDHDTEPGTVDVLCLAPSGASAREFVRWQGAAGEACRILPVDLPGRGRKMRQTPEATLHDTVGRLLDELPSERPYVLFGHSFGGLVAYELTRRAAANGLPLPRSLVVAACRPPHEISSPLISEAAELGEKEMLDALDAAGLLAESLRTSPAAAMIIPALRADLRLLAGYVPPAPAEAAVPVDIFSWYGTADRAVPETVAADWRPYTSGTCTLRAFDGGHFFVRDHWTVCVERLVDLVPGGAVTAPH
ncbi:alpha/beta fold hydrolase [Streptomyces sp. NPDC002825]|uniref:thioesterase II family protein n=1 Tax=Streptomyces sp. NPDC002825 TaxID=3154666 RepID=UPI0033217FBC